MQTDELERIMHAIENAIAGANFKDRTFSKDTEVNEAVKSLTLAHRKAAIVNPLEDAHRRLKQELDKRSNKHPNIRRDRHRAHSELRPHRLPYPNRLPYADN